MKRHALLVAAASIALSGAAFAGHPPPLGTTSLLAMVPAPGYPGPMGFPEGLVVDGGSAYVTTSATFGTSGSGPSHIYVFNTQSGELQRTIEIKGQNLAFEHALSNVAFDGEHRLYALETQQGVIRMKRDGQEQEVYAPIPDLPACNAAPPGAACSPTLFDRPPLPNDIIFDDAGYAYVTDSFQATIWRVPPGGGEPEIWFQDPVLDDVFGPNGIRLSPDRTTMYFAQTTTGFDFGTPGFIYQLPLVDHPTSEDLTIFHAYNFEAPDGMAFGASGKLYVVLALSNQISVLNPDGTEAARYDGAGSSVPFDAPASVAFDGTGSLVLTNHALFTGSSAHFAVLKMFAGDVEDPLERPSVP